MASGSGKRTIIPKSGKELKSTMKDIFGIKKTVTKNSHNKRVKPNEPNVNVVDKTNSNLVDFVHLVATDCQFSLVPIPGSTVVQDDPYTFTTNDGLGPSMNISELRKDGKKSNGTHMEANLDGLEKEFDTRHGADGVISPAETVIIENSEKDIQDNAELDATLKVPSPSNYHFTDAVEKAMPPSAGHPFVNVENQSSMTPISSPSNLEVMDLSKTASTENAEDDLPVINCSSVQETGSNRPDPELEVFVTGLPNADLRNWSRTILSLEMKNFMGLTNKTVEFGHATNLSDTIGKSTVVLGVMLALGQDEILKTYGYELQDIIKIGQPIALVNLKVVIRRRDFGAILVEHPVWIQRKLQIQDGRLLDSVWKLKSGVGCSFVPISKNIVVNQVIPSLNILHWMSGIPIVLTPAIIWKCLERPCNFWFLEYQAIKEAASESIQKDDKIEKMLVALNNRKRFLRETQELHQTKVRDISPTMSRDAFLDIVAEKDSISKLELGIKTMEEEMDVMKKRNDEKLAGFDETFSSRYSALSAAIGLQGQCIIDSVSEEMVCAVGAKLDCYLQKDQLKQQYAVSSWEYKALAVKILITCFWQEMPDPAFFIVDGTSNDKWLKQLVDSFEFKELMEKKQSQQFIVA